MASHRVLIDHLESLDPRPLSGDVDLARIGPYRGYTELIDRLRELSQRGARVAEIGRSVADAPVFSLSFGPADAPRASAVLVGIHPIEWIGVETGLALFEQLVADPPRDRQVIAFPVINVDAYRQVEADLRAGRRRWRRSNRNGVDLNRNWAVHFKARRIRLIAGYNYGGPHPLSEPEVAAVAAALDEIAARAHIDTTVSLHSFGRMILIPYGGRWRAPDAATQLRAAARQVQQRMPRRYKIRQASHWLPGAFARGMELDHLHDRYGATALLVECSGGGLRWRKPGSWIHPFRWFNPPDGDRVARDIARAIEPFVRGSCTLVGRASV